jgi:cephalosporin-C deacetylase-like acetyl esterase
VLALRVRGYPGSRLGSSNAADDQHGWICRGLDAAAQSTDRVHGWVLSETIADVLYAVAALRRALPPRVPIALMGESFGGGIAAIAAAQAAAIESTHPEARVDRLVLGLPTLGDWGWRLQRTRLDAPGMGGQIARFIAARRGAEVGVRRVLSLFDAAVHARLVRCPTVCKVALRDETVPAPTQAAVCNALGSAPGEKARFVTPFGHHDGGLADARRHALFQTLAHEFLDPDHDPAEVLARWQPLMLQGSRPPADAGSTHRRER